MLRLVIIAILVVSCGNPSASNWLKLQMGDRDTLLSDTFKRKEVIACSLVTEEDSLYKNSIYSYKDIIDNKVRILRKINKRLEGSSEAGEAVLYLSGKDTLKMNITFYGETGKSIYVFYLRDGHPVLYIGTTNVYNEPVNISKDVKVDSTTIDKIALRNNVIVSWIQNGKKVNDNNEDKGKEVRDLYNEIKNLLRP
ncbi:hypothetical protein [Chitinophaga solisilvae]|uniref:hypothetical protein n=1 Tax=Chitinophaga solisilvae TaxID=1233460 RepID=UPI00136AAC7E|nr:hypothetical protein [Chitinophaga solisilvae]